MKTLLLRASWALRLALASARGRWLALTLVLASVASSSLLLVGTVQLRSDAQNSFSEAVSGVDLIVGPKGSPSELLLYTAFQLGQPTRNFDFDRLADLRALPGVAWVVPLQLGDSFKGSPVWGTDAEFFAHYAVQGRPVTLQVGRAFDARRPLEAVLGHATAKSLGISLGDKLVLTHGMQAQGGVLSQDHTDSPFEVVGILDAMGGPVDRAVLISLEGFEAVHQGMVMGVDVGMGMGIGIGKGMGSGVGGFPDFRTSAADRATTNLVPAELTAAWVGLENRSDVFAARREIERLGNGELMAVLPGVALDELWRVLAVAEDSLRIIGVMVATGAALSVSAVLMVSMNSRRRELSIFRALGIGLTGIAAMVVLESLLVVSLGVLLGLALHQALLSLLAETLRVDFGLTVALGQWPLEALIPMGALLVAGLLAGLLPAWLASRLSLADGLNPPSA